MKKRMNNIKEQHRRTNKGTPENKHLRTKKRRTKKQEQTKKYNISALFRG
jgi:hypothetical protein